MLFQIQNGGKIIIYLLYQLIFTIGKILLTGIHHIIYFCLYFMVYRFSGAHEKPTADSAYDPAMKHQNNIFTRMLRYYESIIFDNYSAGINPETKKLLRMDLPIMTVGPNNTINKAMFMQLTNNKRRPVVLKKFFADSTACTKWSSDFFAQTYGETKLLTIAKNDNFKGSAYTPFNQKLDCQYIKLSDSIRNMVNATDKATYINNVTEIFSLHPELIDDLDLDRLESIDTSINSKSWLKVNLFMGGPRTGSSLHCAAGGNFFFNVAGQKKWVLVDPSYSNCMHATPEKAFSFVISGHDIETLEEFGTHNAVIPKYEVILEPGDMLYIPPWWWHYVHNETDFTIGCAIRDHTVYWQSFLNNPTYFLMSPYAYSMNPIILKIVELWAGRDYMVNTSMQSDKYIVESLTGEKLTTEI